MTDALHFYAFIAGLLAAFTSVFLLVITCSALMAKLNGENFLEALRYRWDNY